MARVTVLGVRHHGPGSARAVSAALAELRPDAVLVEGPPEAADVLALAASDEMTPPVALLLYAPDEPRRAAFYPFAAFSPEWIAIRHALGAGVDVELIDLPAAHALADDEPSIPVDGDPLGQLAAAAGHDDAERWWDDMVEHRPGPLATFAAISEAMGELRADRDDVPELEARREAAMRRAIRAAERRGRENVVVVCGAWHAPALERAAFPSAAHDAALLKGLPKVKVAATWVPWTNDRLAYASGYGAGVTAPGWYHHLFATPDRPVSTWMRRAAQLLRDAGVDASTAAVIEAVRLADALAVVRGRPLPGLSELDDAALAVLAGGQQAVIGLIARELAIGDAYGSVPVDTPMIPLARDLAAEQRRLRMKPGAGASERALDLRRDVDLERSRLLHRLALIDVPWGQVTRSSSTGTFRESWLLEWQPELTVRLIEAGRFGRTVAAAAEERTKSLIAAATSLTDLTELVERCLLAALDGPVESILRAIADHAASQRAAGELMDALVPLARVSRYGTVRREDRTVVDGVVDALVTRIAVGLPSEATALDDAAAAALVMRIEGVSAAIGMISRPALRERWDAALGRISERTDVHPRVTGRATRLLFDGGILANEDVHGRMTLALSRIGDAELGAAWLTGFLAGTGLILIHDPALLAVLDRWVASLAPARFDDVLPLVRRAFADFAHGERRKIGERVRGGVRAPSAAEAEADPRSDAAVRTVLEMLGHA